MPNLRRTSEEEILLNQMQQHSASEKEPRGSEKEAIANKIKNPTASPTVKSENNDEALSLAEAIAINCHIAPTVAAKNKHLPRKIPKNKQW